MPRTYDDFTIAVLLTFSSLATGIATYEVWYELRPLLNSLPSSEHLTIAKYLLYAVVATMWGLIGVGVVLWRRNRVTEPE